LYAVNIDGTENQELISFFKEDTRGYKLSDFIQMTKLLNVLKDDPDNILIQIKDYDDYPIVYKLDIFTGEKEEIVDGDDENIDEWLVDRDGEVRLGLEKNDDQVIYYKKNIKNDWVKLGVFLGKG
jgi:hypothetical protein